LQVYFMIVPNIFLPKIRFPSVKAMEFLGGTYERKNPELLHAKLGACFANEIYGVTDSEILSAIIWHTTGCPDMSLLDKIVFIADYIEANRDKAEDLPKVRELAFKDIDACLLLILEDTIAYLARKKSVTDPMTQKTYDYYKERN